MLPRQEEFRTSNGPLSLKERNKGIVDPDCKVLGVDRLYIIGSSVFPTCVAGSPTLAIIALAHGLSDCLAGE